MLGTPITGSSTIDLEQLFVLLTHTVMESNLINISSRDTKTFKEGFQTETAFIAKNHM